MFGQTVSPFSLNSSIDSSANNRHDVQRNPQADEDYDGLLSAFAEHNLVIKIQDTKFHVNKQQLIKESPVFEKMLSSDFKEKNEKEIELQEKEWKPFVHFLRCTLPGIDDHISDRTVHQIIPLADEFQTARTLAKADSFLANKCKKMGQTISSEQIIINIIEAETYHLDKFLKECITLASRKSFEKLVKNPKFQEITQETRLKIALQRWEDMDTVVNENDQMLDQPETFTLDFYEYVSPPMITMATQMQPQIQPTRGFPPSGFPPSGFGQVIRNLSDIIKPFWQTN